MSPRLFTASDVERAARLAVQQAAAAVGAATVMGNREARIDVERCVTTAVAMIADDSPPFYSEEDVLHILQFVLEKEDVATEFEDAVATALRR